jgi:hypothetical protein
MSYNQRRYNPGRNRHTTSQFELKWGIDVHKLAQEEDTTPDAIHMRVHRFGTPFQRRATPTPFEIFYRKTQMDLARELDMHPSNVNQRLRNHGSPFPEDMKRKLKGRHALLKGFDHYHNKLKADLADPYQRSKEWLHPMHPDYRTWRQTWLPKTLAEKPWCDLNMRYVPIQEDEQ